MLRACVDAAQARVTHQLRWTTRQRTLFRGRSRACRRAASHTADGARSQTYVENLRCACNAAQRALMNLFVMRVAPGNTVGDDGACALADVLAETQLLVVHCDDRTSRHFFFPRAHARLFIIKQLDERYDANCAVLT